jgi:hypothetical protein
LAPDALVMADARPAALLALAFFLQKVKKCIF